MSLRVLISMDMEGVAGIVHEAQTDPYAAAHAAAYQRASAWMTDEANAAIRGAFAAGATQVLVNDAHWDGRNLLADRLDPRAELLGGSPKPLSMMEGVREADVACLVGYHGRAGTAGAVIDHTYNDTIARVALNGVEVGEIGLNAALAGSVGVPIVLVTGDTATCDEASALLGADLATVATKASLGRQAARSLHPAEACRRIEAAAAVACRATRAPWRVSEPVELVVQFVRTHHADMAMLLPHAERRDGRTITYRAATMSEGFQAWRAMMNLATVPG